MTTIGQALIAGAIDLRACHFCDIPIPDDEKAVQARTKNAWAHFECWYDGSPFPTRDPVTGVDLRVGAMTGKEQRS